MATAAKIEEPVYDVGGIMGGLYGWLNRTKTDYKD